MKKRIVALLLAALALGMSGCGHHHGWHVRDAAERVKAADWTKMETTTVALSEFSFTPSTLVFRRDVPYKLVIENKGTKPHYFTAEGFFKAIATRKLQSNIDGEVKAPYFTAIEVYPGRSLDLYFIPVKPGTYDLRCTMEGHADKGMRGKIRIE